VEAREHSLQDYKNHHVKKLDIKVVDLGSQGFKEASFDLIIAPAGPLDDLTPVKMLLKDRWERMIFDSSSTAQIEYLTLRKMTSQLVLSESSVLY
jgi:hypothetical protein